MSGSFLKINGIHACHRRAGQPYDTYLEGKFAGYGSNIILCGLRDNGAFESSWSHTLIFAARRQVPCREYRRKINEKDIAVRTAAGSAYVCFLQKKGSGAADGRAGRNICCGRDDNRSHAGRYSGSG